MTEVSPNFPGAAVEGVIIWEGEAIVQGENCPFTQK